MTQINTGITDEELLKISSANPELRFELVRGELIAMPPTGGFAGNLESEYIIEVGLWCRSNRGKGFSSSAGFRLPNGNVRSPDAAVILPDHPSYENASRSLTFIVGAPDFLIEIRSANDSMRLLKEKMAEWIQNGCRLAFLIDSVNRKPYVYRQDGSITEFPYSAVLSGEGVLPGLEICPTKLDPGP